VVTIGGPLGTGKGAASTVTTVSRSDVEHAPGCAPYASWAHAGVSMKVTTV